MACRLLRKSFCCHFKSVCGSRALEHALGTKRAACCCSEGGEKRKKNREKKIAKKERRQAVKAAAAEAARRVEEGYSCARDPQTLCPIYVSSH